MRVRAVSAGVNFGSVHSFSRSRIAGAVAAAASVMGLTALSAQGAITYDVPTAPVLTDTWTIGQPSNGINADAVTPGALYSDDTNFSGSAVYAGANGTTKYTALLADDINTTASSNFTLGQFTFAIANGASVSQTITPYIRFFAMDGTGGGPGTYLGGLNFNGIAVSAGNVSGFFYNDGNAITLPPSFWACEYFSTTGSAANAKLIGDGTFNPVDVGTSADEDFGSSSVGTTSTSFLSNGPAGTVNISPFAGAPVANFEWEFNGTAVAVPEPASLSLLAVGAVCATTRLGRRRRSR